MGILLGRAVSVVVCRMQSAVTACGCTGKMSSNRPDAVIEKMSSVDNNSGLQKAIIIPDIHIEHVSRSCDGSTTLLNGNEVPLTPVCNLTSSGMAQLKDQDMNIKLDANVNGVSGNITVELPERFRNSLIQENKYSASKTDISNTVDIDEQRFSHRNRSNDISNAISWIYQELVSV